MSSLELPHYIYELLDQIAKTNGFTEYSLNIEPGAGEGSGTELLSAIVTDSLTDKRLNMVCKMPSFDEDRRKNFPPDINFEREPLFYAKIMPLFLKFQEEKRLPESDQFLSHPKCYATINNHDSEQYAIFLEDLRERDFRMWETSKPLPNENMRLLMRELGKFHGISFALKDQRPSEFAQYKRLTDTLRIFLQKPVFEDLINVTFDVCIKALAKEEHQRILQDVRKNFSEYVEYCVNEKASERFGVLSHGDLHNKNILYHFNDDGIADDVCILDWQSVRFVSPVLDVLHCIFASTDKPLRDKEYTNLIKLYYESLSKTIRMLGSDPNKLFAFENFQDELKRYGNYPLFLGPAVIAIFTDAVKFMSSGIEENTSCDANNEIQLRFRERINGLLEDVNNFGYYRRLGEDELKRFGREQT